VTGRARRDSREGGVGVAPAPHQSRSRPPRAAKALASAGAWPAGVPTTQTRKEIQSGPAGLELDLRGQGQGDLQPRARRRSGRGRRAQASRLARPRRGEFGDLAVDRRPRAMRSPLKPNADSSRTRAMNEGVVTGHIAGPSPAATVLVACRLTVTGTGASVRPSKPRRRRHHRQFRFPRRGGARRPGPASGRRRATGITTRRSRRAPGHRLGGPAGSSIQVRGIDGPGNRGSGRPPGQRGRLRQRSTTAWRTACPAGRRRPAAPG